MAMTAFEEPEGTVDVAELASNSTVDLVLSPRSLLQLPDRRALLTT
jgi:hypothetical protein